MGLAIAELEHVRWHDLECGRYRGDLEVWLALAGRRGGPVLDLGCGTGRIALALADAGFAVTAVDLDPVFLAALAERAEGREVRTVEADVTNLGPLGEERWPLVILPMQTIQLLDGSSARRRMLREVRRHLWPQGLFAASIVTRFDTFDRASGTPSPEIESYEGDMFISHPTAVRVEAGAVVIERERWIGRAGAPVADCGVDVVRLAQLSAAQLTTEAAAEGLEAVELITVPETDEHVANEVVVLGAR